MNSGTTRVRTLQTTPARTRSAAGFHELAALKLAASDVDEAVAAYAACLTFEPHNAAVHNKPVQRTIPAVGSVRARPRAASGRVAGSESTQLTPQPHHADAWLVHGHAR